MQIGATLGSVIKGGGEESFLLKAQFLEPINRGGKLSPQAFFCLVTLTGWHFKTEETVIYQDLIRKQVVAPAVWNEVPSPFRPAPPDLWAPAPKAVPRSLQELPVPLLAAPFDLFCNVLLAGPTVISL